MSKLYILIILLININYIFSLRNKLLITNTQDESKNDSQGEKKIEATDINAENTKSEVSQNESKTQIQKDGSQPSNRVEPEKISEPKPKEQIKKTPIPTSEIKTDQPIIKENKQDQEKLRVKVKQEEKREIVEEKAKILHPVTYHNNDSVIMSTTAMVSSGQRIASTIIEPPCVIPTPTVVTPVITSSVTHGLVQPPTVVRETTYLSTPFSAPQVVQRNLRVVGGPGPVVQGMVSPITSSVVSSHPILSTPVNRVMAVSTTTTPQPPVVQKFVTQNTINGIPTGPPVVSTVVTPPQPVVNRVITTTSPLVNRVVTPLPNMSQVLTPVPVVNRIITPPPLVNPPPGNNLYVFG